MQKECWRKKVRRIRRFSPRDAALIAMLVNYGLKPGELLGLKHEHVDWSERSFVVDERRFKLDGEMMELLGKLRGEEETWIFRGRGRRALTARQLQLITSRWVGKTPGELRREFALEYVAKGGKLHELRLHLGHANLITTARLLE